MSRKSSITLEKSTFENLKEYKGSTWNDTMKTIIDYFEASGYSDLLDIRWELRQMKNRKKEALKDEKIEEISE